MRDRDRLAAIAAERGAAGAERGLQLAGLGQLWLGEPVRSSIMTSHDACLALGECNWQRPVLPTVQLPQVT